MVTMEQAVRGLVAYAGAEIIPKLSGARRFGASLYMQLAAEKAATVIPEYLEHPAVKVLGIGTPDAIDVDRLRSAALTSFDGDSISVDIPCIGTFSFGKSDIDSVCDYIRRA